MTSLDSAGGTGRRIGANARMTDRFLFYQMFGIFKLLVEVIFLVVKSLRISQVCKLIGVACLSSVFCGSVFVIVEARCGFVHIPVILETDE